MSLLYHTTFNTAFGWMRPISDGTSLIKLDWNQSHRDEADQIDDVSRETMRQILEYLAGTRVMFDLPLAPEGKNDAARAWLTSMANIPYGKTLSYKEFADLAGMPRAPRAAGSACARNPIPIIYPCHRVVRGDGSMGSYGGGDNSNPRHPANLDRKKRLIMLERENS